MRLSGTPTHPMRATRAYIFSLGTTSLLVASSFLILIVVSTIVAFDGWPGSGIADRIERIVVGDDEGPSRISGPALVAVDAAPAAAAVAATPAPTAPAGAPGAPGAGGGPVAGVPTPGGGGGTTPAPAAGGGGGTTGGGGGGGGSLTDDLSNTTRETTDGVGKTVSPVSPELGKTVSDTGKALSDIVNELPDVGPPKLP
jgi:hypothetical protein